eukprot:969556-Amphidinium_carterae.1
MWHQRRCTAAQTPLQNLVIKDSHNGGQVLDARGIVWRRLQDRLLQDHFMMHYYAFEAVGFPSDATDHEELHNFFSDAIKKLAGVQKKANDRNLPL